MSLARAPAGFTLDVVSLDAPAPGSVEGALVDAGLGGAVTLTDLRPAPPLDRIRSQSATVDTPLHQAFDAVVCTPTATADSSTMFGASS
ncbi:hypothetical protein AB0392_60500 [Nonomuraea angiospora]|uniref:hypothetical protein n=1 Tax=Nonomuraea angiospora TaxID=46172 RepID=UPI00344E3CEE